MSRLREQLLRPSILRRLLLMMVFGFIIPLILFNALFWLVLSRDLKKQAVVSYDALNRQIAVGLDTTLRGVAQYTSYPYFNSELNRMLDESYSDYNWRTFRSVLEGQIMIYNDYIDSAIFYCKKRNAYYTGGWGSAILLETSLPYLGALSHTSGKEAIIGVANRSSIPDYPTWVVMVARTLFDLSTHEEVGFLCLNVDISKLGPLFEEINTISGVRQYVLDGERRVLYSANTGEIGELAPEPVLQYMDSGLKYAEFEIDGKQMAFTGHRSDYTHWTIISMVDTGVLLDFVQHQQKLLTVILALVFLGSLLLAAKISLSISRPLRALENTILQVEGGDLTARAEVNSSDEVGRLAGSFNRMAGEIDSLFKKTVTQEEEKRAAELGALQAQINPHFLYNTLNTIKWLARMQCADNISDATDALIYLLNYASANTEPFAAVREEAGFLKRYVSLMQLRHYDSFDVRFDFEEGILDCLSLKFMLQPFVENAIFHGFHNKDGRNLLRVSGRSRGEDLVFCVADNGVGMEPGQIERILSQGRDAKSFNSIGICNVVARIRLNFGEPYGVQITSVPGEGTKAEVVIPNIRPALPDQEG